MLCVISQPTFIPWIGWFDLVDQSDTMVILDDVAFSKQSWQQRNRIRTPRGLEYVTVPVKSSGRLGQKIMECELANPFFVRKIIATLRASYAKAPFFAQAIVELATTMETAAESGCLLDFNLALISWMADKLEVTTPMIRASELGVGGGRGEHVAAICAHLGANIYCSAGGAENYLIEDKVFFDQRGILIQIHEYVHPEYVQRTAPFLPFASALDLIFNTGPAAGGVMRSGRRPSRPIRETI